MEPMTKVEEVTQEPPAMESGGGIDDIIARVQSYQENPQMVTPETLGELLSELMDLKTVLDGEEGLESESDAPSAMSEMTSRYGGMK